MNLCVFVVAMRLAIKAWQQGILAQLIAERIHVSTDARASGAASGACVREGVGPPARRRRRDAAVPVALGQVACPPWLLRRGSARPSGRRFWLAGRRAGGVRLRRGV